MKIKQYIHITNVDSFVRRDYSSCFTLFDHESGVSEWIVITPPIEIEVNLDANDLRKKAIDATDAEIAAVTQEATKKLEELQLRKQELLALTYNPEDQYDI